MKVFTFKAYGKTFTTEDEDMSSAMVKANKALLWSNPESKDGAWSDGKDSFLWIEGNFFD